MPESAIAIDHDCKKEELQAKIARVRYGSFLGNALVAHYQPGIEVLESFGRPTAVWMANSGRLYLLHGWHATPSNTLHVREFASQKTGAEISDAKALREMVAEEDLIAEYAPTVRQPQEDASPDGGNSSTPTAVPPEDQELLERLQAEYRKDARPGAPAPAPVDGSRRRYDEVTLTRLIEEWLNDLSDPRADELVDARFNTSKAQSLLRQAGFLEEDNAPTDQAEAIGIVRAAWRDRCYALYPRERISEYRDLIYRLNQASKAEETEQTTEATRQQL